MTNWLFWFMRKPGDSTIHMLKDEQPEKTLCGVRRRGLSPSRYKGQHAVNLRDFSAMTEKGYYPLCQECEVIARDMWTEEFGKEARDD